MFHPAYTTCKCRTLIDNALLSQDIREKRRRSSEKSASSTGGASAAASSVGGDSNDSSPCGLNAVSRVNSVEGARSDLVTPSVTPTVLVSSGGNMMHTTTTSSLSTLAEDEINEVGAWKPEIPFENVR